jgi:hypothetical protein
MANAVLDALVFILLGVAWAVPLMLVHELGHALAALAVTDGEVRIGMRSTPSGLMVGECTYEPAGLRHPRAEALIAAAGPLVSLLSALVLAFGSLKSGAGTPEGGVAAHVLMVGAVTAFLQFVVSALPVRYGAGLGGGAADSDGRAVWRILTGAPPGGVGREERRLGRPERAIRPAFVAPLLVVAALVLIVDPLMVLLLVALFALAWRDQRSDRAARG